VALALNTQAPSAISVVMQTATNRLDAQ